MDYAIYVAKIEGSALVGDTRLRVRVLPHMENLDLADLPRWPHFFAGQALTGPAEDTAEDYVWVLSNTDFTVGYVLGYAAPFTYSNSYQASSIPKDLMDIAGMSHYRLNGVDLAYKDISVTYWDGNSLHFVDRSSGGHYIAFRNGTIHSVHGDSIAYSVGKSQFKMTATEIYIVADTVRIGGAVRLGSNPQGRVVVANGPTAENAATTADVWS